MRIGCIVLAPVSDISFVAIECKKGRGIILPGGSLEAGETVKECAMREFREETGILVGHLHYLMSMPNIDPASGELFNVVAFSGVVSEIGVDRVWGTDQGSGRVTTAVWGALLEGGFKGYYQCLKDIYLRNT
jgi:8-oxo-dGTP pyrophosphatase MutT (NUDIX family)